MAAPLRINTSITANQFHMAIEDGEYIRAASEKAAALGSTVSAEHINAARYRGYPEQAPTPPAQQNAERTPAIRFKDSSLVDEHGTPEFLLNNAQHSIFAKFIVDRQDPDRMDVFRMAS